MTWQIFFFASDFFLQKFHQSLFTWNKMKEKNCSLKKILESNPKCNLGYVWISKSRHNWTIITTKNLPFVEANRTPQPQLQPTIPEHLCFIVIGVVELDMCHNERAPPIDRIPMDCGIDNAFTAFNRTIFLKMLLILIVIYLIIDLSMILFF